MKTIIGIDPGVNGAMAGVHSDGGAFAMDLPVIEHRKKRVLDPYTLGRELRDQATHGDVRAFVEEVWAQPNNSRAGAFSFGRAYGTIIATLAAAEIPFELVTPAMWKRRIGAPKDKDGCRAMAQQMFPSIAHEFKLKKDEHKAEAILIAMCGRRMMRGRG